MSAEWEEQLFRLIREVMPRRMRTVPLSDSQNLNQDLAIDSLSLMSLAFRVEEEFAIDVIRHAERLSKVFTVGELREFVQEFASLHRGG